MRKTTALISVLASTVALSACGGQTVKGSAMSTYAQGKLAGQLPGAKVDCPDSDYKQGATVKCDLNVNGKKGFAFLKIEGKQDDKVLLTFLRVEAAK
jgi:hypothetical protein